jgi:hypothetical protein
MSLPTYPTFDCHSDGKAVRWNKWTTRLDNLFVGYNITNNVRKKALLLTYGGDSLNDLVDTIPEADLVAGEGENVYDKLVKAISDLFNPSTNTEFQKYTFRNTKQKTDSINEFYTELKQIAETCDFGERMNAEIKSQLIAGCKNSKVRHKGLSDSAITLEKLLEYARTLELTEAHSKTIEAQTANSITSSSPAHRKRQQHRPGPAPGQQAQQRRGGNQGSAKHPSGATQTCRNCGGAWPHQGGRDKCPAFGKSCAKCKKRNHFAKVCRSDKVNHVDHVERADNTSVGDDYTFANVNANKPHQKLPSFKVHINQHPVIMLADSGSTVNLVSENDYQAMSNKPILSQNKTDVFAYGQSESIELTGSFMSNVQYKNRNCFAQFFVVKGDKACSLLSWETSQQLGLIATCHAVSDMPDDHSILSEYPELFKGVGKLKDVKIKLHIDESVKPVAQKARRVPFHVRKDIEMQLENDENLGIIEKTNGPTPWVSPVVCVPKPQTGKTRVCVDMRQANKAIRRERHSIPTIDELINELSDAKVFSKLDLNQGYNQLELDEESRYITTFATHQGLRRYTRLFFGISSAAEVFNETIRNTLVGLKGTINISDDILVFGKDDDDHDRNLRAVLNRLRDRGLTLNRAKCELNKSSVEYFGHVFGAKGVSASPTKIKAINDIASPQNATELRSLLGLMNYCGSKFVPDYATLTHELRQLTHKDVPWHWTEKHENAVQKLKEALCNNLTLNYFSTGRETEVYCDASPVGLCAILVQIDKKGERHVVQFASRSLTAVESRYSQTERESLSIVFGCEHFHTYLYGAPFTVITDHKPLTAIFGRNATKTQHTPRIERWAMRLQPYNMQLVYKPGKDNPADYFSRHPHNTPKESREETVAEEYVQYLADRTTPKAMTLQEVATATADDPILKVVMKAIQSNKWYEERVKENLPLSNLYKKLFACREQLSLANDNTVIMKANRIILPDSLQQKAVEIAHTGHQGVTKTLALLREKVWFSGMTRAVEDVVKNCMQCQISTSVPKREPLAMSELPSGPWIELSADFGQVADGTYILVVQDEYSRYVVVDVLHSQSAKSVIPRLDKIFAEFGIPKSLKTDNGPPFQSSDFAEYLKFMGVKHRKITTLWPRANGETERFMRTIKKVIRGKPANWKQEMYKRLLAYRATPHSTTGVAPATLLFGRDITTKLPSLNPTWQNDDLRAKDHMEKEKMKKYADQKSYVKPCELRVGDNVLIKNVGVSKSQGPYDSQPLTIVEKKGSMVTAKRGEKCITRNSSFFKPSPQPPNQASDSDTDETDGNVVKEPEPPDVQMNPPINESNAGIPTRPKRNVRLPEKYSDYVMGKH